VRPYAVIDYPDAPQTLVLERFDILTNAVTQTMKAHLPIKVATPSVEIPDKVSIREDYLNQNIANPMGKLVFYYKLAQVVKIPPLFIRNTI